MTTRVVHCKKEPFDVYIGRPGKWGNPFKIDVDCSREESIRLYREWLTKAISEHPELLEEIKKELKEKILGCWCAPRICHGGVLAELADV